MFVLSSFEFVSKGRLYQSSAIKATNKDYVGFVTILSLSLFLYKEKLSCQHFDIVILKHHKAIKTLKSANDLLVVSVKK